MGKLVFVLTAVLLPATLSFADSSGHLAGDISGALGLPDGVVDFFDLAVMAGEWASDTPQLLADIAGTAGVGQPDGVVDCIDFAVLAEEWLACYDTNTPVDLVADANFSRDSIAFSDGKKYAPGTRRLATLAVSSVSDCVIHGAENVLGVGPVILAPKCSAGGYIYATETNHNNIYRSSDGCDWEQTASNLTGVFRIFGTQSGAILVARADHGNMKLYKSIVGGQDLSDQNLTLPVLILPNQGTLAASLGIWNFHQAQNGTICLSEYGTQNSFKKSRIYRSIDDGSSFTQVYDEPDLVYHSHRIMKHEATGRWVDVYGDGAPMNKVVKSDDDGLTWSTLDPQPDNHFQPVDFYDYGDPTNLLYGSDSLDFIGTFDVITRKITPLYSDGDRYCPYVFSIFYYDGVYYAGTFSGRMDSPNRRVAILVSSDLNHWAVYHQFRNGEQGINKFLGVWGGRIHGIVTLSDTYTWRHFSFTPATVTLVNGLCLDPATVNMLNN
ncbi:MAG: hypothetical protein NTX52_04565, partial [Planctomycetota bacterium]|nr:hypothetical protein [Planctomycetota bacterium]